MREYADVRAQDGRGARTQSRNRSPPKTFAKKPAASSMFRPPSLSTIFLPFLSYTARRLESDRMEYAFLWHMN